MSLVTSDPGKAERKSEGPTAFQTEAAPGAVPCRAIPCRTVVVRGGAAVLELRPMLMELSRRTGQVGAMDHLEYYFARPGFRGKRPALVLLCSGAGDGLPGCADEVEGAVLLYEYLLKGVGCRVFCADYHGGERTVIAAAADRARVAFAGSAALLEHGALAVLLSYEDQAAPAGTAGVRAPKQGLRWAAAEREMTGYLPVEDTVDGTFANLGKHTRRNLRLYRRRAEADLGYVQINRPEMTREEFVAFNRICAYPVSDALAGWRYEATQRMPEGCLFLGLRAANGDWLSLIGGRTQEGSTVIEWQMNRADLPAYSLSVLMRSHLIEHEVERGSKRIYFVAGTSHSIRNSMVPDRFVDLMVLRYRVPQFVVRRLVRPDEEEPNFLMRMLSNAALVWRVW